MELHERPSLPVPPASASTSSKPRRHLPLLPSPFSSSFLFLLSLLTPSLFSLLQDRELPWMLHRAQVQQSNPRSRALLNPVQIQAVPVGSMSPRRKSLESCSRTFFFQREGAALERNDDRSPGCVDPQAPRSPGHSARRVNRTGSRVARITPSHCTPARLHVAPRAQPQLLIRIETEGDERLPPVHLRIHDRGRSRKLAPTSPPLISHLSAAGLFVAVGRRLGCVLRGAAPRSSLLPLAPQTSFAPVSVECTPCSSRCPASARTPAAAPAARAPRCRTT